MHSQITPEIFAPGVFPESSAAEVENKCRNPDERSTVYFKNPMIEINIEPINKEGLVKEVCHNYYRPQTKFAKVMFLQVCVCPRGGGHEWLPRGGVHGFRGDMHGYQGACMVAGGRVWFLGGMHGCGGHVWLLGVGACMAAGGCAWLLWGACVVNGGWGCTWLLRGAWLPGEGACMAKGGFGMHGKGACVVKGVCVAKGACMGYDEIRRYDQ